jgi:DNA-binding transcriptional ArsR family regulator
MVIGYRPRLDGVFQALADPIRREMLTLLARGEATAGELGAPFRISQPAASKHIRMLERAGLVSRSVDGRIHRLRLVSKPLREAEAWISRHRQFWEGSLDSLGETLDEITRGGKP